jgi:hypothetical protein
MSKKSIIGLSIVGAVILLTIVGISWIFSVYNGEVRLRNAYESQFNVREVVMDKMRKTLMAQFKVSKESADMFIESVAAGASGRKGGALFKSNAESAAGLGMPLDVYQSMLASIEGNMSEYMRSQITLTDMWQSHKTYCESVPNSIFVGSRVMPKPEMISSDTVKEAIKTKRLNDNILEEI